MSKDMYKRNGRNIMRGIGISYKIDLYSSP